MALPVPQKVWTISANNRITFVSLNDTMGRYLKGVADFLLAHGYTCKGSCDGTTGAMDGVNRWTSVANASVRGANTATANSWMVLTDANGCDILLSYVGATDDIGRIAYSPGGLYVAAGTPNQTPTATDDQVLNTITVIGTDTTLDRIWHGWVDSESKLCRFALFRSTANYGCAIWGVELLSSRVTIAFSPTVWGFKYAPNVLNAGNFESAFSANSKGGRTRVNGVSVDILGGYEKFMNATLLWNDIRTELQFATGYPMCPLTVGSTTATREGPLGDLYDWWTGRGGAAVIPGDPYNQQFIQLGDGSNAQALGGLVWPWDGVSQAETA